MASIRVRLTYAEAEALLDASLTQKAKTSDEGMVALRAREKLIDKLFADPDYVPPRLREQPKPLLYSVPRAVE